MYVRHVVWISQAGKTLRLLHKADHEARFPKALQHPSSRNLSSVYTKTAKHKVCLNCGSTDTSFSD